MPKRPNRNSPSGRDDSCQFCLVGSGESDAKIVFEDAISIAFLDNRPLFPGHCLLIPKGHFETFLDLPADLIGPFFSNAQLVAKPVQEAMQAEGTFVAMNNTVSQSVSHFHVHIVPRRRGDGLRGFFWPRTKYKTEDELVSVRQSISSRFKK
jgi:histidine triad (HIT) family protein